MDPVQLDLTRQKVGAAYLAALERLALRPDSLFGSFDALERRSAFALATEMFDLEGPLGVSELPFKAPHAAA